jgi:hypothetical protein
MIGFLTATSPIWVDVTWIHRGFIWIFVALAMETLFSWMDNRDRKSDEERKQRNRDQLFETWK